MGRHGFVLLAGAQTLTQTRANPFSGVLGVMRALLFGTNFLKVLVSP
jgi:hypothetical protein